MSTRLWERVEKYHRGEDGVGVGKRVRIARLYAKLTQDQLGQLVGLSRTSIYKVEVGETQSSRRSVHIAKACGVCPIWLETGEGQMADNQPQWEPPPKEVGTAIPVIPWEDLLGWESWKAPRVPPRILFWLNFPHQLTPVVGLVVEDDMMEPEFTVGDIVTIHLGFAPGNLTDYPYVVANLHPDGRPSLRRLVLDGEARYLRPLNPRYPNRAMTEASAIYGVVLNKVKTMARVPS